MDKAHQVISRDFENYAIRAGLTGAWDWRVDGDALEGVLDLVLDGWTEPQLEEVLGDFLASAREYGEIAGFTIQSRTLTSDAVLTVYFQIVSDADLETLRESGKLDKISQQFTRNFDQALRKRRPKRKQSDLADPSKSHDAYVNQYPRLTKQFKTDVKPELADRVDAFRKATGLSKRDITEAALEAYLDANEPD